MRIELFCENCKNRWLCKEPCARWYDNLEEELKQQKGELNMANFKLTQTGEQIQTDIDKINEVTA